MRSSAFLLIGSLLSSAFAQAASITPIFNDAAFRVGLTLPFSVEAVRDDSSARIHRVSVVDSAGTGECRTHLDPKIAANFLLKCDNVAKISLKVLVVKGEQASEISYGPIEIQELKAGYREPKTDPGDVTTDPDVLAGRAIIFSKVTGRGTCVGCHTTPGKYPGLMTATAAKLKGINSNASMTGVGNLTTDEANKVVKYLQTISDAGEWP